jgi:hypothetical protein
MVLRLRGAVVPCFLLSGRKDGRKDTLVEANQPEDFWDYVKDIIDRGQPLERPFFPSHEGFRDISVSWLPPSQGLNEIRVFDSWIVSPLQCRQLRTMIEETKEAVKAAEREIPPDAPKKKREDMLDEAMRSALEKALPDAWIEEQGMLLRFIQAYGVSVAKGRGVSKEMSKKEKCEIWRAYIRFLKKLQTHALR